MTTKTLFCPRCEAEVDVSSQLSATIPASLPPLPDEMICRHAGHTCDPQRVAGNVLSALAKIDGKLRRLDDERKS